MRRCDRGRAEGSCMTMVGMKWVGGVGRCVAARE